jgi:glyoxylase-like metal-dependent hydrolase (beta-lactamase superfamily II)
MMLKIGDTTIEPIVESVLPFLEPHLFFPTMTQEIYEENRGWLAPRYLDPATGKLLFTFQSHLIRTPHHTILLDTCAGNHKPRDAARYPMWNMQATDRYEQSFKAAGVAFTDIDVVMCTHLHVDHVGWNTRLDNGRWVPTFPNARYLVADRELAFWSQKFKEEPALWPHIGDSVLPVVEARQVDPVKSTHQFSDEIVLLPTPGHTIDHFSVRVGRKGDDVILAGDMIHSPLQARYPELGMRADHDSVEAGRSRRRVLGEICETSTRLLPGHFALPSIGRITRWGDGFRFVET